jgi:hypothetical protein
MESEQPRRSGREKPDRQPSHGPMGVPGEEHKLWAVPRRKGDPLGLTGEDLSGKPGKYRAQLLLSRPGYPVASEREHKFIDNAIGDSHVLIAKPLRERVPGESDQVLLQAFSPAETVTFIGIPNANGYLGKLVAHEISANNLNDAETRAYGAAAPFLSAWSLHLDIPVHVETIQVTELATSINSLRVRTPHFEMTFAGGMSPLLTDDFSQYASLYREGMNSNSGFYRFLCFYKIIESIPHRRSRIGQAAKKLGEDVRRFYEHVPADRKELLALLKTIYPWRATWDDMALGQIVPTEAAGKKIGWVREKHLNPLRVGIAHALLKTGEVRITLDKIDHIQQVNKWLPLCRVLARLLLNNEFPDEFALTMKATLENTQ